MNSKELPDCFHTWRSLWTRQRLSTVVSARWATVDWSKPKEWNWCARADLHFKKKKKKKSAGGKWFDEPPAKVLASEEKVPSPPFHYYNHFALGGASGECWPQKKLTNISCEIDTIQLCQPRSVIIYFCYCCYCIYHCPQLIVLPDSVSCCLKAPIHFQTQSPDPISCYRKPVVGTNEFAHPLIWPVRSTGFLYPRAHLHVVRMLWFMPVTLTNRTCPLLFIVFLCLFLSLWPF